MLKVYTDDNESRQRMMDVYSKECLQHLEEAMRAATLCFRESVRRNAIWGVIASVLAGLVRSVKEE
jgi:hypothetical protein